MIDKGLVKSPTTKIYLATPWFNDVQKERAKKAREYLNQNETVGVIHFPFDFQYKDATVDNDPEGVFGTPEWVAATFQNDCTAVATSDIGVFLYDLDNIDTVARMSLLCSAASRSLAWSFRSLNATMKTSKSIS